MLGQQWHWVVQTAANPTVTFVAGFVIGAIAAGILGNAAYDVVKRWTRSITGIVIRIGAQRGEKTLKRVTVGRGRNRAFEFVYHFDTAGLAPDQLRCRYAPVASLERLLASSENTVAFPIEISDLIAQIEKERRRLAQRTGSGPVREWNGRHLALRHIRSGADPDVHGILERPYFELQFAESDYAALKTISSIWAAQIRVVDIPYKLLGEVMPGWSHSFGANATVETSDGALLLTRRADKATRTFRGCLHISMNEGMRPDDLHRIGDEKPLPDVFHLYRRGFMNELGLKEAQLDKAELTIHSLILDLVHYEWAALGHLKLADSTRDLKAKIWAGEDWEHDRLEAIDFTKKELDRYLFHDGPWVPHGALNLVLSAILRKRVDDSWLVRLERCRTGNPATSLPG